ncbi:GNAT family N-acetyltransferase [Pontibacter sp. G13]|uniref:GNAT family N-acetyltransferase n=1 Tax=Pontibacter sp. G13 TaxID=3074898 RepID=UPI00288ABE42|nr:GNAT family N-acetyltransferase [Pontibacter sp. G13]WNJ17873.1 GNAT family N-acetyltransferase [Pontibacter sp. G13]
MQEIRLITQADLPALKQVLDSIELFPAEMLEDMIADFFSQSDSEEIWFTETDGGTPISIGFCAPEKMTEGTFNLYAIGVQSDYQGKGTGSRMMAFIEELLRSQGHRILIVDTSGTEEFTLTRKFYQQLGYAQEAVIRDFWAEGDDKVVFWKRLNG